MKSSTSTLLSVVLTVAVVVATAFALDWSRAAATLKHVRLDWIAAALGVFAVNYWFRTLRFRLLLNDYRSPLRSLLAITILHGLFNYLLPAKSGELSYVVLTKRHLRVPVPESTATLIVARFFDFGVIALLLPFALAQFYADMPGWLITASIVYCGFVLVSAAALIFYLRRTESPAPRPGGDWLARTANVVQRILQCLRIIDQRRQYTRLWLITVAIWMCVLLNYFFIVSALGFSPNLSQMIVISIILIPLTLAPVQGVANVGTHEAGWVAAFSIFGYGFEAALNIAVTSHIILFSMFVVLGCVGYALTGSTRKESLEGHSTDSA